MRTSDLHEAAFIPRAEKLFLTAEQLRDLTGYQQAAAQIRWLQRNGVMHYVRADGRPAVTIAAIEKRDPAAKGRSTPNFAALRTGG